MKLLNHWNDCFTALTLPLPPEAEFHALQRRYSETHRAYHTQQHIEECFDAFAAARPLAQSPGAVGIALWYHDAIYDTHARDNEEKSADLACRVLEDAGAPDETLAEVRALILATRHATLPVTPDEGLLVDIDLSILGAIPTRFDEYERQVRQEYAWVEETMFRTVRAQILRGIP